MNRPYVPPPTSQQRHGAFWRTREDVQAERARAAAERARAAAEREEAEEDE